MRGESCGMHTGDGLFLGNSMPIRDMDMYADPASAQFRASGDAASEPLLPLPAHGFGVVQGAGMQHSASYTWRSGRLACCL